ncbi:hypothetical protein KR032_001644 [Drosophila birchii]|nr:hypothetical protein KR032_001644 [Drosophila birchii]
MNTFPSTIAIGLAVLFLFLALGTTQKAIEIDVNLLSLREKSDKFAYCRDLRMQKPEIPLENTKCDYYLRHDPKLKMADMLLASRPHCRQGWALLRGRCRKLV